MQEKYLKTYDPNFRNRPETMGGNIRRNYDPSRMGGSVRNFLGSDFLNVPSMQLELINNSLIVSGDGDLLVRYVTGQPTINYRTLHNMLQSGSIVVREMKFLASRVGAETTAPAMLSQTAVTRGNTFLGASETNNFVPYTVRTERDFQDDIVTLSNIEYYFDAYRTLEYRIPAQSTITLFLNLDLYRLANVGI